MRLRYACSTRFCLFSSLTLFKENTNANTISFDWTVDTFKGLSLTHAFFFEIFLEGSTGPSAISLYFNITAADAVPSTTASTAPINSTPASSLTSTRTGTTTSTAATNTPTSAAAGISSGGLSSGAKVGLAFGIIVAIFLGVSAGWFFFGRRRTQDPPIPLIQSGAYYEPDKWHQGMPPVYIEDSARSSVVRSLLQATT
jgi:hypothetical protein